jgi:hypothetical protein
MITYTTINILLIYYNAYKLINFLYHLLPLRSTNLFAEIKVIGDITKDSTLIPEYFKGVKKVVNAVSVIVGPKEGDTPDRAKYSQVCSLTLLRIEFLFFFFKASLS